MAYGDKAREAINDMFSDQTVTVDETREGLTALRDEIDLLIDTLPDTKALDAAEQDLDNGEA